MNKYSDFYDSEGNPLWINLKTVEAFHETVLLEGKNRCHVFGSGRQLATIDLDGLEKLLDLIPKTGNHILTGNVMFDNNQAKNASIDPLMAALLGEQFTGKVKEIRPFECFVVLENINSVYLLKGDTEHIGGEECKAYCMRMDESFWLRIYLNADQEKKLYDYLNTAKI